MVTKVIKQLAGTMPLHGVTWAVSCNFLKENARRNQMTTRCCGLALPCTRGSRIRKHRTDTRHSRKSLLQTPPRATNGGVESAAFNELRAPQQGERRPGRAVYCRDPQPLAQKQTTARPHQNWEDYPGLAIRAPIEGEGWSASFRRLEPL